MNRIPYPRNLHDPIQLLDTVEALGLEVPSGLRVVAAAEPKSLRKLGIGFDIDKLDAALAKSGFSVGDRLAYKSALSAAGLLSASGRRVA